VEEATIVPVDSSRSTHPVSDAHVSH